MTDLQPHRFRSRDGWELVYRELGAGRPLVLIHGFFSSAVETWVRPGHAARLADLGYRVLMPDLRGHGDSARPHDASAYPPDVTADDGLALVGHLGLTAYDLGGYSLGARTTVRMLARGATPERVVVAGQGLREIVGDSGGGAAWFRRLLTNLGTFPRGTPEWRAEEYMRSLGGDPVALLRVLDTAMPTPRPTLARILIPALVLAGRGDVRDALALAECLPHARYAAVPGNHVTALAHPEFGVAIADFLGPGGAVPEGPPGGLRSPGPPPNAG